MFNVTTKLALSGLFVCVVTGLSGSEQAFGQIRWRNDEAHQVGPAGRAAPLTADSLEAAVATHAGRHVVVQFRGPLTVPQRAGLEAAGMKLLGYLGDHAFFASISPDPDVATLIQDDSLKNLEPIRAAMRQHPAFATGEPPVWAVVDDTNQNSPIVAAYVLFHADVPLVLHGVAAVERHGAVTRSYLRSVNGLVVELPLRNIEALAGEDVVQWIEPPLPLLSGTNNSNRQVTQVETVQTDPQYGLDGAGVTVLVYDGGTADEGHPDFGGRLTGRDESPADVHSTHVSGTIGGDGYASSGVWRGMAPGVTIESYGFEMPGGLEEGFLYTDPGDLEQDYNEAVNVYGANIANNSIGTNVCINGFDCEWTGDYGVTSQLIDAIVAGSLGTSFCIVWAAGNERDCDRCTDEGVHTPDGYHSTAPPACAKNHIVVGAINSNDESMTPFSSWGPTDDGRLKPDIVAPGCEIGDDFGVTSSSALGGYLPACGTSMAAPTVTGSAALLLQDFRDCFPGQDDFRNSTLKALLTHNAHDLEPPGPDYKTGYGALRIKDTIDFMRTGDFFEAQVNQQEAHTFLIRVNPSDSMLKVTLVWDDVPGTPNVEQALVNDLDLRVYDSSGGRHYPWTLDPEEPGHPAERARPDHINNIEQVVVDLPGDGLWLVEVYGYNVPEGPQPFSLCAWPGIPVDCDHNGTPDDEQILAYPALDCSGNGVLDICEPDCDGDGTADSCEIVNGTSSDCNLNGIPDDCEEWADCNVNGMYDPCDVSNGYSSDCNRNWIPDKCETDCNSNSVADECDITSGTSEDCDRDGVPDECQPFIDCNFNLICDRREIAAGIAEDFNHNGIPDDCEFPDRPLYVDVANCPGPGTGTPVDPFCRVQDAIDHAIAGHEIIVAQGIYAGIGNRDLDFRGRRITLRSTDPADPDVVAATVIDCEAKGRGLYFHCGETHHAVVDGFTIYDGLAAVGNTPGAYRGAGIYCKDSSPTIRNCVITEGTVGPVLFYMYGGGGIYCERSEPTIDKCTITANFTYNHGGGVYCYDGSNPLILNCTIADNVSFSGAGIACGLYSSPDVVNCTIADNTSGSGGSGSAILCYTQSDPTIRNCMLLANDAYAPSGAIDAMYDSRIEIDGCTLAGNVSGDGPGGIHLMYGSIARVRNSIIWDNAGPAGPEQILLETTSEISVAYSDVEGGLQAVDVQSGHLKWFTGNLDDHPAFVDENGGDYRLTDVSPCIDRGNPCFTPNQDETDVDGEERVQHCRVDIGADESPFFVDCNANDVSDACELTEGTAEDCDADSIPDECQDTSADCNDNGVWDLCDIAYGTVSDCNANNVPDECDILDGTSEDCNENGVPDECDIVHGTSDDVNVNGIPDSCEFCMGDNDCSDGVYCTGIEQCVDGLCRSGDDPCPSQLCVEETQSCAECMTDEDCDDWNECVINTCDEGICQESYSTEPCDDGELCTESDVCVDGLCIGIVIPGCGPMYALRAVAVNSEPIGDGPADNITVNQNDVITCEIFLEHWIPRFLRGYNVMIDPSGYTSGPRGYLAPLLDPNPSAGAFIDQSHPAFVFSGLSTLTAVWNQEPTFYQYVGLVLYEEDCAADLGTPVYLGTLVLTVSNDAAGTFIVCLDDTDANGDHEPEYSYMRDCDNWPINPIDFECLTIYVFADCNHNGVVDDQDIADGTSEDCSGNGVPDECEPDCNANDIADSCDILDGTSEDCNDNHVPDSCDISDGTSIDCDGNTIPDECEPDCNENGITDACDITEGTSDDCNSNTVPDECDLADGTSLDCDGNAIPDECQDTSDDCNGNGVWDMCDITDGTSKDCNGNYRPDECDIDDGISQDCDENGVPDECADYFPRILDVSEIDETCGMTIHGADEGDASGRRVAGAGDVNGDGIDDILIGAPKADHGGLEDAGEAYVLFGGSWSQQQPFELSSLLPESGGDVTGFVIRGIDDNDYAGDGLSGAGDVNGDGIGDIIIGAPGVDLNDQEGVGQAYILFGHFLIGTESVISLADLNGTNGFAINGINEGDFTARNVASAGDVNGDGLDDVLISAHVASLDDQDYVGRVYVLFGQVGPWPDAIELSSLLPENGGNGAAGFVINGIDAGDFLGSDLADAGDVNDDGFDDIILGAYAADPGDRPWAGQAYVVFGGPNVSAGGERYLADLNGTNGLIINGIDAMDLAGDSVAAAGDVNSDGIADLLIGAVWADPNGQADAGETYVIFGHSDPWPEVFELSTLLPGNGGDGTIGLVINGINESDRSGFRASNAGDINDDGSDDIIIGAYGAENGGPQDAGEAYVLFGHTDPWPASFNLSTLMDEDPADPPLGFVICGDDAGGFLGQGVAGAGDFNNDGYDDVIIGAPIATPDDSEDAGKSYVVFGRHASPRDCNGNGILDQCDIRDGTSEDCNGDETPDECQDSLHDCNGNDVWDVCDILHGTSQDCNDNTIPDECDIADGDSQDCNENDVPDECETTDPPDCNDNGVWDLCDIYTGDSGDCNVNGIPDDCEPGGNEDCNTNEIPDLCDIADGTSQDINANAVPDECQPHHMIYVSTNTCDPDGGSGTVADPFCRIQDAIDTADNGAQAVIEVLVADGVYAGPGNRDLNPSGNLPDSESRAVWVHSEDGPANCLIDCEGYLHAFLFSRGEGPGARVEGFTILGAGRSAIVCMANSNPTIHNCVITRTYGDSSGAGIECIAGSPLISHCLIIGNTVDGIYCADTSNPTIVDCAIVGNDGSRGGGIYCADNSNPTITRCTVAHNVAQPDGGGLHCPLASPSVTNSIVWHNVPNDVVGAADVTFSDVPGFWHTTNIHRDPLFAGGPAGTWTADGQFDPQTRQATLTDETASWQNGEFIGCTVNVASSAAVQLEFAIVANSETTLTVWGDVVGMAEAGGEYSVVDYCLMAESPCVNAGDFSMGLLPGETDLDGQERVRHCRLDMGAHESPHLVDCNENGLSDACEALEGAVEDCDRNGVPDECEADCNRNGIVDACDITYGKSEDRNLNGVPDECEPRHCDLNGDGSVDASDVAFMEECRRTPGIDVDPACEPADLNGDHHVTDADWHIFVKCYRKHRVSCGIPTGGTGLDSDRALRSER